MVAYPCNQFGAQESGSNAAIKAFTQRRGFDGIVMSKTKVNGSGASPVFDFLKVRSKSGGIVELLQVRGEPGRRTRSVFPTNKTPAELVPTIEKFLRRRLRKVSP